MMNRFSPCYSAKRAMAQKNMKSHTLASTKQASMIAEVPNIQVSKRTVADAENAVMSGATSEQTGEDVMENFIIVWLDANLNFYDRENQKLISQLRRIVNKIQTFTDIDLCFQYLAKIKDEEVFLITSGHFSNQLADMEEAFRQLYAIYIFCDQNMAPEGNVEAYKKGKGIFTHMPHLCTELEREVRLLENSLTSRSIIPASATLNLNELDPSFMYCQLLTESFFTIQHDENAISEFIDYCRPRYEKNDSETQLINKFNEAYALDDEENSPIKWYTEHCFLYKILNKALKTLQVETLMKISFYIRDLYEQIRERHSSLQATDIPSHVFRGQRIYEDEFQMLKGNQGGLWSFNNFLSTSTNEKTARSYAQNSIRSDAVGILLEIAIDASASSVPFVPISDISRFQGENEVLFSVGAVFRIGEMHMMGEKLWRVSLTMTNDRDPIMKRLVGHIRKSLGHGSGWRQLGQLMLKMGQYGKAKEIYDKLMHYTCATDDAEWAFLHNQLGLIEKQIGNLSAAFHHYQKSVDYSLKYMSPNDHRLSSTYSNIGAILKKLNNLDEALEYFQIALKVDLTASQPNQLEIAVDHNNIGSVLDELGKYPEALRSYHVALDIKVAHLPPNQSSLATSYSNIGLIHRKMGDCSAALSYYEKALNIQRKGLQPNHPSLITTHSNMATVLEVMGEHEEAMEHAKHAANVAMAAFGSTHPETKRRSDILRDLEKRKSP